MDTVMRLCVNILLNDQSSAENRIKQLFNSKLPRNQKSSDFCSSFAIQEIRERNFL
ncbi:hypothetical protein [Sphingobacterium sp. LRF_L2]|uniref:hypothetical protein n=1 Tax=Sphingobacterium sp. LRF_L2 TaxID=3369421 RepID=UPI003F626574